MRTLFRGEGSFMTNFLILNMFYNIFLNNQRKSVKIGAWSKIGRELVKIYEKRSGFFG